MSIQRYWKKIPEYYNLRGKKCISCSELYFPSRDICKKCGSLELKNHFFEGKGEIVTYTIIRTAVTDYEGEQLDFPSHKVPYVMAIIKLDEGPMLTAEVVDSLIEDVQIGKNAEMVFRKIIEKGKKGAIHYGYKFRLV